MFDEVAPRYDLVNAVMTFGLDRVWRRRARQALGLPVPSRVLDLACGTADFARELAAQGHRALGLDVSPGMLAAARPGRAPLVLGDGAALPVASASLDGIVSGFALRNFADLPRALTECARVLRPLGRLAILEVDRPTSPLLRAGHALWFGRAIPRIGGLLSSGEAYRYLVRSLAYLPAPAELQALLERSGFSDVRRRPLLGASAQLVTATRCGGGGVGL